MTGIRSIILVAILLIGVFPIVSNLDDGASAGSGDAPSAASHASIMVESDAQMDALAISEGLSGSGTPSDPYIISGWDVDGTSSGYCMIMRNLTRHVVISRCTLTKAVGTGLDLVNDRSIAVDNSTMSFSGTGVRASYVNDLSMIDCQIINSSWGIDVEYSTFTLQSSDIVNISINALRSDYSTNYIDDNEFLDCLNGMTLVYPSPGRIDGNLMHRAKGIQISNGGGQDIFDNTVNDTDGEGYRLWSAPDSSLYNNIASKVGTGYSLQYSDRTTMKNNSALDCLGDGISMMGSDWCRIDGGTIDTNQNGITINWGYDNIITNATVRFNIRDGVFLQYAHRTKVTFNTITHGLANGISSSNTNNLNITGNTLLKNNLNGISLTRCRYSTLIENDITSHQYGISLDRDEFDKVVGNYLRGNIYGLFGLTNGNGTFLTNTFDSSSSYGIYLSGCEDNHFHGNVISRSKNAGYYSMNCKNNLISGNAFLENNGVGLTLNYSRVQASASAGDNSFNETEGLGNYWRDHTRPDANGDGIVDIAYPVSGPDDDERPLADPPFPLIPTGVRNVTCKAIKGRVELEWDAPAMDGGSILLGYNVYRIEGGNPRLVSKIDIGITHYTDIDVKDGKKYIYQIASENSVGESVLSNSVSCISDGSPPWIYINSPMDGMITKETSLVFLWECSRDDWEDDDDLIYDISLDGIYQKRNITTRSFKIGQLSDGTHVFTVYATDRSENTNSTDIMFTVDTMLPIIRIIDPAHESYTNRTEIEFTYTLDEPGSGIRSAKYSLDGSYKYPLNGSRLMTDLMEGRHVLSIEVTDLAGNFQQTISVFYVDLTPPSLEIVGPEDGAMASGTSVEVALSCNDSMSGVRDIRYILNGGQEVLVGTNITFMVTGLVPGDNWIEVLASDIAGNVARSIVKLLLDSAAPTILDHGPKGQNLPVGATIFVLFSEPMDKGSVFFNITGLPGALQWIRNRSIFNPFESLGYGKTYTVTIFGDDIAGNALIPFTWTFSTTKNGSVKGIVLDPERNALPEVSIEIGGVVKATTNSKGEFLMDLPSGYYDLRISKPGYEPQTRGADVRAGDSLDLGTIFLTGMVPSGTVSGRVIDTNGKGIMGVLITSDSDSEETTDSSGEFSMSLHAGNHFVRFVRDTYMNQTIEVLVEDGKNIDIGDIAMKKVAGTENDDSAGIPFLYIQIMIFVILIVIGVLIFVVLSRSRSRRLEYEE
jgi:parallel beta-helix repeat protein